MVARGCRGASERLGRADSVAVVNVSSVSIETLLAAPSRNLLSMRALDRSMQRRAMGRGQEEKARTGRKGRRPIGRPTSVDPRRSRAAVADRATEASRGERSPTPSGRSRPGFRNATSVKSEKATSIEDRLTWLILPGVYARLKG